MPRAVVCRVLLSGAKDRMARAVVCRVMLSGAEDRMAREVVCRVMLSGAKDRMARAAPPRHLLGSHTVLGVSVPGGGVNFALFMAYSFSYKFS